MKKVIMNEEVYYVVIEENTEVYLTEREYYAWCSGADLEEII